MKKTLLLLASCVVVIPLSVLADVPLTLPSLKPLTGAEMKGVTITEAGPDGIRLVHEGGLAKLAWDQVPAEVRVKLGWSDDKLADYKKAKDLVDRAAAAESAAQAARARLIKRKIKPLPVSFTALSESGNGMIGTLVGKPAYMLGAIAQPAGTVLNVEAWRDAPMKINGISYPVLVPVQPVVVPGLSVAKGKMETMAATTGSGDNVISPMEIASARKRLSAANTPTQVLTFKVTDTVYNGILGTKQDGKLVYVIGPVSAKRDESHTATAWPDGTRTIGGKTYEVWVTIK